MRRREAVLGIDLGTSTLKVVVLAPDGAVLAAVRQPILTHAPRPGWAEQEPSEWWDSLQSATQRALGMTAVDHVAALGLSGQMHGTVLVDRRLRPLTPAVIWLDRRADEQVDRIRDCVGSRRLIEITGNPIAAGFQAATLLWFRDQRADLFDRSHFSLLPKDYLRLRLTGEVSSEPSDASGTGLFDVREGRWSSELCHLLGLPDHLLPPLIGSRDIAGGLTEEAASALGLEAGTAVIAGGSDQAMGALGMGLVEAGQGCVTLATGGQVMLVTREPFADEAGRLHLFHHAVSERSLSLAATLSAGLSLQWISEVLGGLLPRSAAIEQVTALAEQAPPGSDGVVFLPYLVGERTPHMDPRARGAFVGLDRSHGATHLARAVMEGVAYSLRDGFELLKISGHTPRSLVLSGGGASSELWAQLLADVLDVTITKTAFEDHAPLGAALLAGVEAGFFDSVGSACLRVVSVAEQTPPDNAHRAIYDAQYRLYEGLYRQLRSAFEALSRIGRT